tara:strand:- start:20 stop:610 length:591 start_codon:yes stop_codon:yes gene_type:complete
MAGSIERGDFFSKLLTFCGTLGRSMKQSRLHGAQRILGSGDPKNLQAQLRKVLPIYSTISLEVVSADDILETKVPLSTNNMNHLGTMHAGITWMAAEVLGGLAYLGHWQDFGQAWAAVKGVEIEFKRPVTSGISAKASFPPDERRRVATELEEKSRSKFALKIEVTDEEGNLCAVATGNYVLRRNVAELIQVVSDT